MALITFCSSMSVVQPVSVLGVCTENSQPLLMRVYSLLEETSIYNHEKYSGPSCTVT